MSEPVEPTPANALTLVAVAVGALSQDVKKLVVEITRDADLRSGKIDAISKLSRVSLLLVAVVLLVCGLLGYQTFEARKETKARSAAATEQRAKAQESIDILNDCVTPGGKCYKRSLEFQKQQQERQVALVRCQVESGSDVHHYDVCVKAIDAT